MSNVGYSLGDKFMNPSILTALVALLLMNTQPALAYIEPGSGGMMVQLLIAGTFGLGMWMKIYWNRFLNLFRKRTVKAEPSPVEVAKQ